MPIDFVADKLNLTWVVIFLLFIIFPGLVSMRIFRLMAPAKEMDWKNASYESAFLGTINFLIAISIVSLLHIPDSCIHSITGYSFFENYNLLAGLIHTFLFLVAIAAVSPFAWIKIRERGVFKRFLLAHHPSAWDFYFSQGQCCFVLVHLKGGALIGGYYGLKSFATSYPEPISIYIENVIQVDETGKFGDYTNNTSGVLLYRDDFDYIEFFNLPSNILEQSDDIEPQQAEDRQ